MIISPEDFECLLGESIKQLRLQKNLDRVSVCERAGISVTALRHLEGGDGATIKTLIRILIALDKQDWLKTLAQQPTINPLHMVRHGGPRQRARKKKQKHNEEK